MEKKVKATTCQKSVSGQLLLTKRVKNNAYCPAQMQNAYRLLV